MPIPGEPRKTCQTGVGLAGDEQSMGGPMQDWGQPRHNHGPPNLEGLFYF